MSTRRVPQPHDSPEPRVVLRVAVEGDSRDQVAPLQQLGPGSVVVRAVKGSEVTLHSPVFLPKGCRIAITGRGSSPVRWSGVVRRAQMVDARPSYRLLVRIEEGDTADLGALRPGREPVEASAAERGLQSPSAPGWARFLIDEGVLTRERLGELEAKARAEGLPLERIVTRDGGVSEDVIARNACLAQGVPFVDPGAYELRMENAALLPPELARRHRVFPLFHIDGVITLGMVDASNLALIDQIRLRTNRQVDACGCLPRALDSLIERAYRTDPQPASAPAGDARAERLPAEPDPSEASPVVRLVNVLIQESARDGASDVHIEPDRGELRVRIRVDGILHKRSAHPIEQHAQIVSRIKVLAKLDIAETRRPQDGQFRVQLDEGNADVRVSTVPTVNGEAVVLRLLLADRGSIDLDGIGMSTSVLHRFEDCLDHPHGMILVTGPTGSGKTTTLYAALARLATVERNLVTIEDPVEKRLPLLRQLQVSEAAGLTFASGLRSVLRQDPDVIMVGEIRDRETAEIATQAALTGHLVLSTLHTNTAAGAVVRLSEMGVPPVLINASLRAVIGQRLVRRNCVCCSRLAEPDPRLAAGLGVPPDQLEGLVAGVGCGRCLHTGFQGRAGIYEMLELTPGLSAALASGATRAELEGEAHLALGDGLLADGLRQVRAGVTTLGEVARVVGVHRSFAQGA
ncbi:MAG: GspE/PulE family protein [Planctomycetota bacterium]